MKAIFVETLGGVFSYGGQAESWTETPIVVSVDTDGLNNPTAWAVNTCIRDMVRDYTMGRNMSVVREVYVR